MGQGRGRQEGRGGREGNSRHGYGALALAIAHRVVEFVAIVVVVTLAIVAVGLVDAVVARRRIWVSVGESRVDLLGAVVSGRRGLLGLHHGGRVQTIKVVRPRATLGPDRVPSSRCQPGRSRIGHRTVDG